METKRAGEIMIPLEQYPHVPYWFTLRQVIAELEKSEFVFDGRVLLPRVVLVFDDEGRVEERQELAADGPVFGAEIEPGRWHALAVLEPAVVFELKEGPYSATGDKDFATWAPAERAAACEQVVAWYEHAEVGERLPR